MTFIHLYDETKAAFAACRKSGRRPYYPKALKENAVKLLDYYPLQVLTGVLSVTENTLRDWQNQFKSPSITENHFVEVKVTDDALEQTLLDRRVSFKIQLPNKLELLLSDQAMPSACEFVSRLVKEFDACSI